MESPNTLRSKIKNRLLMSKIFIDQHGESKATEWWVSLRSEVIRTLSGEAVDIHRLPDIQRWYFYNGVSRDLSWLYYPISETSGSTFTDRDLGSTSAFRNSVLWKCGVALGLAMTCHWAADGHTQRENQTVKKDNSVSIGGLVWRDLGSSSFRRWNMLYNKMFRLFLLDDFVSGGF